MLHYYFYSIKNLINFQQYIGITGDLAQRKRRHFNCLRKNKHFNPHLQNAWNKYGEENFSFEVIEEKDFNTREEAYLYEAELIKKYDSINNGYNCNPGGLWAGPQGRFKENEVYYIKAVCYFEKRVTGILAKYFNCAQATIENIRINRNYKPYCESFNNLPEEEKRMWFEEFCSLTDFGLMKQKIGMKSPLRKYSKEQVFLILRWIETKFTTAKKLCDFLGIECPDNPEYKPSYKFRSIKDGKSYKDFIFEYNQLSENDKKKIERLYTEKCIEQSL